MPRGRKTTWNFDRIAGDYNLWFGGQERKVDGPEARAIISKYQPLFRRLVRHERPHVALFYMKLVLDGRMTEKEVVDRRGSCLADVPLIRTFRPRRDYEPRLPSWFLYVVRAWLEMRERVQQNPPPSNLPVGADYSESISLSYYLMADCLLDEQFIWAMTQVKAIWRMDEFEAKTWFRWLHEQQEAVIRHLFPAGVPHEDELLPYQSFGSGGGWTNPLDDRNARGKLAHGPYGLPVLDYKSHLGQLVRLAGGDPMEEHWQDWVERLLWSLDRREEIVFPSPDDGTWQTTWLRSAFLSNAWTTMGCDIPHAPPTKPYVSTAWTEGNVQMMIRFPSRAVALTNYPEGLRHDLLNYITSLWGLYRTPLTAEQRIAYLKRLSGEERGKPTDEEVLEGLWEEHETELERMSIPEQEHTERIAVRRSRNRQRKDGQRAGRRLRE